MNDKEDFCAFQSEEDRLAFLNKAVRIVAIPSENEFTEVSGLVMFRLKIALEPGELRHWCKFNPLSDRQDLAMLIGMAMIGDLRSGYPVLNDKFLRAFKEQNGLDSIEAIQLFTFHPSSICLALNSALFECDHEWVGRADTEEMVCRSCGERKIG